MAIALAIILLTMTWKRAILFVTEAITMTKIPACTISMQDTYYGKNREMKYSMHLFNKGHQWIHWHTELPHSKPINNFLKFIWKMISGGI